MSALGLPVLINQDRAYWLSSIGNDTIHSTIQVQELDANVARISTLFADQAYFSSFAVSTLDATDFDVSGMIVSSIAGNTALLSTLFLQSGDGVNPFLRFTVDPSGVQVDGCPIRFDNLVYLTSTINIVQVSTLVDTDLFAANGYFSSISTGSLSANTVSFNQANISSLYVSSLEAFDLSGADPKDWSLYPTLNSSITFQPGNVLSNVGNKLFFAGFELTDASGGGIDWSIYPAISTVQMNNNILTGLSTINFQDSATLTSLTGNNLRYNGLPVQYGNASNITQWASYPAVSSVNMAGRNLSNAASITTSNAVILGDNITSGYTFTNSLGVGGLSLTPIASLTAGGDLSIRNLEVGDSLTSLADVNIYGATAAPGDNALYVEGGVTFAGGTIHGFTAGCLPVAGINTCRIDVLQAGINLLTPTAMAITAAGAIGITAGGALSLAGGGYVEMNTSTLQMINTSQGNKNTTVQAGFLTIDPDNGATSSIKLFNTLGGGVEIDGGGQGSLIGFSTVRGATLSTINLNVSTINGVPLSSIQTPENIVCSTITSQSSISQNIYNSVNATLGSAFWTNAIGVSTTLGALRVNNIQIADNLTGVTNAPNPNQSRLENFSSIQSGAISTGNIRLSSINGLNWNDISGGGGGGTVSTYNQLFTSSLAVSTLAGVGFEPNRTINVFGNGFKFVSSSISFPGRYLSALSYINSSGEPFNIFASTIDIIANQAGSNGYIRIGQGGAFDTLFNTVNGIASISTAQILANSSITNYITVSTLAAFGGDPIKVNNALEFLSPSALDNVDVINLNPLAIPNLNIQASTLTLTTANTYTQSLSTLRLSTSAFSFSTATSVGSNTAFNFPIVLDYDHAGASTAASGVAIAIQGHNLGSGAVVNRIEMGTRATGENYILSIWPGQNLEDLAIESSQVTFNDGAFSTILNSGSNALVTTGNISAPSLLVSSINGNNATVAFTNSIQTSSMTLYTASTTLLYWHSATTSSNINTSGYDVVVGTNGTYKVGASLQFINQGGTDKLEFFFQKNNAVISQAGGIVNITNGEELLTYMEIIEPFVNGDSIQVGCYTAGTNVFLSTVQGTIVESPAAILTMYRVNCA